jgi:hypothetical protein
LTTPAVTAEEFCLFVWILILVLPVIAAAVMVLGIGLTSGMWLEPRRVAIAHDIPVPDSEQNT